MKDRKKPDNVNSGYVKKIFGNFFHYLALFIAIVFFAGPFIWQILTAFNDPREADSVIPRVLNRPSLSGWLYLQEAGFLDITKNSLIVVFSSVLIIMIIGIMAAYAIARFDFKGKRVFAFEILTLRMIPPIVTVIPIFILFKYLNLLYTYQGLSIVYITFNLPMTIWVLAGFFKEIPKEIEEAALIDGCSYFSLLWKILVPLAIPGVMAVLILNIIFTWNEFIFALVITSARTQTLPVAASGLMGAYVINWGGVAVVAVYITIPVLILALSLQRYLVRGLTLGAVKE